MVEISTSILSMEKGAEAETILELEKAKTDYFHIDVMDGKFVEKDTYKKMREYNKPIFITNPSRNAERIFKMSGLYEIMPKIV